MQEQASVRSTPFKLAKESIPNKNYNNVLMINNIDNMYDRNGLDMTFINDRNEPLIEDDEIQYMPYGVYTGDSSFYGDLCCYSESLCEEQSIQMIDFRFNTAQRELTNSFSTHTLFDAITYDEIGSDDFDDNDFKERTYKFPQAASRREGYYYKPHYQIPIKTYDKNITTIAEDSLNAILESLKLLKIGGVCCVVVYPGHPEGARESELLEAELRKLDQKKFNCLKYDFINWKNKPAYLIAIEKIKE